MQHKKILGIAEELEEDMASNKRLIHKATEQNWRRYQRIGVSSVSKDDMFQECSIAFILAHKSFDPDKGFQFSTFYWKVAWTHLEKVFRRELIEVGVIRPKRATNVGVANQTVSLDDRVKSSSEITYQEFVVADEVSADKRLEMVEFYERLLPKLSVTAQAVVRILIEQPDEILAEHRAYGAKVKRAKEKFGKTLFLPTTISFDFVCRVLGVSEPTKRELKREVERKCQRRMKSPDVLDMPLRTVQRTPYAKSANLANCVQTKVTKVESV